MWVSVLWELSGHGREDNRRVPLLIGRGGVITQRSMIAPGKLLMTSQDLDAA